MSSRNRSKRATHRKPARAAVPAHKASRLRQAQDQLEKAQDRFRRARDVRQEAVREEWERGMSAQAIADTLKISRSKVYQLLKSGAPRRAPQPRATT